MSFVSTQAAVARAVKLELVRAERTQSWLAGELGVGPMWVSQRMTGRVLFDTDDIDRVASALGMDSGADLLVAAADEAKAATA